MKNLQTIDCREFRWATLATLVEPKANRAQPKKESMPTRRNVLKRATSCSDRNAAITKTFLFSFRFAAFVAIYAYKREMPCTRRGWRMRRWEGGNELIAFSNVISQTNRNISLICQSPAIYHELYVKMQYNKIEEPHSISYVSVRVCCVHLYESTNLVEIEEEQEEGDHQTNASKNKLLADMHV